MYKSERLQSSVNELLESYEQHPQIQYINSAKLPTKQEIIHLTEDILTLIFPGLIRQESLDSLGFPYRIGQKMSSLFIQLQDYIQKILCWKLAQAGKDCQTTPYFQDNIEQIAFEFLENLPHLRKTLAIDIQAFYEGDPAANSHREVVLAYPGLQALSVHRIAHFFYQKKVPLLPRIMSEYIHSRTGIDIHPGAEIGLGNMIDHGTGVVIGETAVLGNYVRIYQGVTLGALSPEKDSKLEKKKKRHPTIGNHVVLYAGATILGGDTFIGDHSVIGGNVWLTHSVPANSTVYQKNQSASTQIEENS